MHFLGTSKVHDTTIGAVEIERKEIRVYKSNFNCVLIGVSTCTV